DASRERAPARASVLPADLDRGAERQLLLLCTAEHRHRRWKLEDRGHRRGPVAADRGPGAAVEIPYRAPQPPRNGGRQVVQSCLKPAGGRGEGGRGEEEGEGTQHRGSPPD